VNVPDGVQLLGRMAIASLSGQAKRAQQRNIDPADGAVLLDQARECPPPDLELDENHE
jgi:hypothetical protein